MKIVFTALVLAALLIVPILQVAAQSPEMPVPTAVIKDADGKTMVQVITLDGDSYIPKVLFNFDGVPAAFYLQVETGHFNNSKGSVYFSGDNCTGTAYLSGPSGGNSIDVLTGTSFAIMGPDATTGTYRVFRTTSPDEQAVFPESKLEFGNQTLGYCKDEPGNQIVLASGEEILPNPLEGFHGPTVANPERLLTVSGGTRLP